MQAEISKLLKLVELGEQIRQYVEGIALVTGVIGSVLIFLILSRKAMRAFPSRVYFICLAAFDLIGLVAGVPFDLLGYSRSGYGNAYNVITCQLSLFFVRGSGFVSLWTLVVLALDRLIAVIWPLRAKEICTYKRTLLAEAIIIVVGYSMRIPYFWSRGEQTYVGANGQNVTINCGWTSETWFQYSKIYENVSGLLSVYVAILVVIICNVVIVFNVRKSHRLSKSNADASRAHTMTLMMIAASAMLFLLHAPHLVALSIMTFMLDAADKQTQLMMLFVQNITVSLAFLHQASNFYLYCLAGSKFREELRAMFGCLTENTQTTARAVGNCTGSAQLSSDPGHGEMPALAGEVTSTPAEN